MVVCWQELLGILPAWMKESVNKLGKDDLQELRLRLGKPPQGITGSGRIWFPGQVSREDLSFCINAASGYSPWAAATMSKGYLTAPGGHRIGVCGEVVLKDNQVAGIRQITGLCIRVARDIPGIAGKAAECSGSILILGAPGWGKTTLLRDLIRFRAEKETVAVADERGELFPAGFACGPQTDVLLGAPKPQAILRLLKTMGPQTIAVDEITAAEDCLALLEASCCGVSLLATAHAGSMEEFQSRRVYEPLIRNHVFQHVLTLRKDKTYQVERTSL